MRWEEDVGGDTSIVGREEKDSQANDEVEQHCSHTRFNQQRNALVTCLKMHPQIMVIDPTTVFGRAFHVNVRRCW